MRAFVGPARLGKRATRPGTRRKYHNVSNGTQSRRFKNVRGCASLRKARYYLALDSRSFDRRNKSVIAPGGSPASNIPRRTVRGCFRSRFAQGLLIVEPSVEDDFLFGSEAIKATIPLVEFATEPMPIIFPESVAQAELQGVWIARNDLPDEAIDPCQKLGSSLLFKTAGLSLLTLRLARP